MLIVISSRASWVGVRFISINRPVTAGGAGAGTTRLCRHKASPRNRRRLAGTPVGQPFHGAPRFPPIWATFFGANSLNVAGHVPLSGEKGWSVTGARSEANSRRPSPAPRRSTGAKWGLGRPALCPTGQQAGRRFSRTIAGQSAAV